MSSEESPSTMSAGEIILQYVCPAAGMVVANIMFMAPLKDLQKAVSEGRGLGDLNPTPWAFMLGNCFGWVLYGVLVCNWFVFWANYPGFLISCWLNLGAVKLMYSHHHHEETRRSLVRYLSSSEVAGEDFASRRRSFFQDEGIVVEQPQLLDTDNNKTDTEASTTVDYGYEDVCLGNDDSRSSCEGNEDDETKTPETIATTTSASTSTTNTANAVEEWTKIVWDVTSQTTPAKIPHERLVMGMILLWTMVLSGIGFSAHYLDGNNNDDGAKNSDNGNDIGKTIVGYVVNFNLVFFYGAPLSTIAKVLKTKSSDSLHAPTMTMNTANAIFWTSYALSPQINDPFIYVPNGLGVALGIIQFALYAIFPNKKKSNDNTANNDENENENETKE